MVRQMKERHAREEKVTAAYFTGFTFVSNAAKAVASVTSCHVIYPKLADASNRRKKREPAWMAKTGQAKCR